MRDRDALTVVEVLDERSSDGDAPFLIHCERSVSFRALADESRRLASGLRALGIGEGDRVAIWLPTTPAWLASFFACARLGAIAVALNTRFGPTELIDIVGRSGAKVLIYWPGFPSQDFASVLARSRREEMPALAVTVRYGDPDDRGHGPSWCEVAYDDLITEEPLDASAARPDSRCVIFTTSGTTRKPKLVVHDQRSVMRHAFDVVPSFGMHERSVLLLVPPLCGVFGFTCAMASLAAGRPMVTSPAFDPAMAARWIDRYAATHVHGTDDALARLLDQNERVPAFPTVELSAFGAFSPLQADIVERADARGLKLVGIYGSSELQGLSSRQSASASTKTRFSGGGRTVSGQTKVRARSLETGEILLDRQVGELEFWAPDSRFVEYLGDPEATARAFTEDGFFRSGDLGFVRADGSFVYESRIGDAMRLSGFLVNPVEIEHVVQEHGAVSACQVVEASVDGAVRPVAFVTPAGDDPIESGDVIAFVARRLARYKVPTRIFAVDAFPMSSGSNGMKVQRGRLRIMAEEMIRSEHADLSSPARGGSGPASTRGHQPQRSRGERP